MSVEPNREADTSREPSYQTDRRKTLKEAAAVNGSKKVVGEALVPLGQEGKILENSSRKTPCLMKKN